MALDKIIFPKPFSLGGRDPKAVSNFQQSLFSAASDAQRLLRREIIPAGTKILRNVPAKISKDVAVYDFEKKKAQSVKVPFSMTADEARTIPPGSATTQNRWSGAIADAKISRGALYTCLDPIAFANEALRYSRDKITKEVTWKGSADGKAEYTVFGSYRYGFPPVARQ